MNKLLDQLNGPDDLKKMTDEELFKLSLEIRRFLLKSVSETGGHLASNLGVVELSIALHRVFNSPQDKIVWDVGHQGYVHKILTGRKNGFENLRTLGGMSGFLKHSESEHDAFGAGHSSTSISAAMGFAKANKMRGVDHEAIAVIGDGALTGGMAFEALNHAGLSDEKVIVVLNDNEMSICENVGGLSKYLGSIRTTPTYYKVKDETHEVLDNIPVVGQALTASIRKLKESVKQIIVPGMFFEELGLTYIGPLDGHNLAEVEAGLRQAKHSKNSTIVHVITVKGKGYKPAEMEPDLYHGVGAFDLDKGVQKSKKVTYSSVFGEKMMAMAEKNENIVAITAAMPDGTGLDDFKNKFKERFVDVGIAEQHGATFAAGLAAGGFKPYFAVYSTFLQRAYDQILHDICIQKLPVVFAIDRAGLVGNDGETHHGAYDISFLNHMPNMMMLAPKDKYEFERMLQFSSEYMEGPIAVRYPRGNAIEINEDSTPIMKPELLSEGSGVLMIAVGKMVQHAMEAAEILKEDNIEMGVLNPRVLKPLDKGFYKTLLKKYRVVVTVEDNAIRGGFGDTIGRLICDESISLDAFRSFGIPDRFIKHGSQDDLFNEIGLDSKSIASSVKALVRVEG